MVLNCKGWVRCHQRWAHRESFLLKRHPASPHLPFLLPYLQRRLGSSCHPNGSWHLVYFQERNACTAFFFFFFPIWSFGQTQRLKWASTKTIGKITEMILNLTYARLTPVKPNCVLMITLWPGSSKQTAIFKAFRARRMPSVRAIPLGRFRSWCLQVWMEYNSAIKGALEVQRAAVA